MRKGVRGVNTSLGIILQPSVLKSEIAAVQAVSEKRVTAIPSASIPVATTL
jgi:hypothetical protein